MKIVSKTRNYRMFKKRYAEMDLYQEYRRSHERVKVMLDEKTEEIIEEPVETLSAQDNLNRFISKHETTLQKIEDHYEEQMSINLAEETIPETNKPISDYTTTEMFHSNAIGSESPPLELGSEINQNFRSQSPNTNTERRPEGNLEPMYEQEYFSPASPYRYPQESYASESNQGERIEKKPPVQHKKVEDELDDIIRDALAKVSPNTNVSDSDVDPELLDMIKTLLVKNNPPLSDSSFSINYQDNFWNIPEAPQQPAIPKASNQPSRRPEDVYIEEKIPTPLDQQFKKEKAPPKVPTSKSTVKRPEIAGQPGVFDPSFSTADIDDDSSLALTKQEISMQVKNLLRESLEETKQETSRPNDLLELEKQLKEHIEKIKQSKNNS